jgi:hypothetical protein
LESSSTTTISYGVSRASVASITLRTVIVMFCDGSSRAGQMIETKLLIEGDRGDTTRETGSRTQALRSVTEQRPSPAQFRRQQGAYHSRRVMVRR